MSMRIRRKGEHPDWGTKIYDYGKPEVQNFLIANALFWTEQYPCGRAFVWMRWHPCCIWITARMTDEWVANIYGGNENLEAIEFLKHLNSIVQETKSRALC